MPQFAVTTLVPDEPERAQVQRVIYDELVRGVVTDSSREALVSVHGQEGGAPRVIVVERTNAQRAQYGLPPLQVDVRLLKSARNHAAWMTNNRSMTHTTQPVGENIAMGQRSSGEVVTAIAPCSSRTVRPR